MQAILVALRNVFGVKDLVDDIDFAGRTDRWIMRQIFEKFGLAPSEANFTAFAEAYVAALPEQLANPAGTRPARGARPARRTAASIHGSPKGC